MVILKTQPEIEIMREAGRIAAKALHMGGNAIQPGITTREINEIIHKSIIAENAKPSFLGYGGFPASACVSINNEVIHGIPGDWIIHDGDIVSIDVGAEFEGFHGDNAYTFICGEVSDEIKQLLEVTKLCLQKGIEAAVVGNRIGDIGYAVQKTALEHDYGVVKDFVGHAVGRRLHEDPQVPNYGVPGRGTRILEGMTLAIEPMINMGHEDVRVLSDDWTVVTLDGSLCAHFEHTIAVTANDPEILTLYEV